MTCDVCKGTRAYCFLEDGFKVPCIPCPPKVITTNVVCENMEIKDPIVEEMIAKLLKMCADLEIENKRLKAQLGQTNYFSKFKKVKK